MPNSIGPIVGVCTLLVSILFSSKLAGQIDWNNSSGTPAPLLDDDRNWSGGIRPGSGDLARFNLAGTYEVWWNGNTSLRLPEVGTLSVMAGDVTFLNQDSNPQYQLDILGPGGNTGTQNDFRVSGSGTTLTNRGLHLRCLGGASIANGATFNIDGSHSAGSQFTQIGWSGFDVSGNLNVLSGGIVDSHESFIGNAANQTGTALVTGVGSEWNNVGRLFIGNSGSGDLTVQSGGVVNNTEGYIGHQSGSNGIVHVDGVGSLWANANWLRVGNAGNGELWIQNGGRVTNTAATIGSTVSGVGMATVLGAGSFWDNSAELTVGNNGDYSGVDGTLNIFQGGAVASRHGYVGLNAGSQGTVLIDGIGSNWNVTNDLQIGRAGDGSIQLFNGASLSSQNAYVGRYGGSGGSAELFDGSTWTNTHSLYVGHDGQGFLDVNGLSTLSSRDIFVANTTGSNGTVAVSGTLNASNNVYVGGSASGSGGVGQMIVNSGTVQIDGTLKLWSTGFLTLDGGAINTKVFDISDGGTFHFNDGTLTVAGPGGAFIPIPSGSFHINGDSPSAIPTLMVTDGAQALGLGSFHVGTTNGGAMVVSAGGTATVNSFANIGESGMVTVTGTDSQWTINGFLNVRGLDALAIENGGRVTSNSGSIGYDTTLTSSAGVSGANSQWTSNAFLAVGASGLGELAIDQGGSIQTSNGRIGNSANAMGTVTVSGVGSTWQDQNLAVGYSGQGTLQVDAGGVVTTPRTYVGQYEGSTGTTNIQGAGSALNTADLYVGFLGNGTMNVLSNGQVNAVNGRIGDRAGSMGAVTVTHTGSQWVLANNLFIGGNGWGAGGTGTLDILYGGLVSVGNNTTIYATGGVNLDGGRFEFGTMSMDEFNSIHAVSGSLAGNLNHTGYTQVADLPVLQNTQVDVSGVHLSNSGILFGQGSMGTGIVNQIGGQLETLAGERMRFAGASSNAGEINNFGGVIRFDQELTNLSGGFVSGRGQFIADGGWINQGVMAFSGGPTDILGDLDLQAGGQIVVSRDVTASFFDDVVHNGVEIRTAAGSSSVFFGAVSGAGPFTGAGTVVFEGDLRPGNSPAVVEFDGNLEFGNLSHTVIELAGWDPGEFDQLIVAGDLFLDGQLSVQLLDGFHLSGNDRFLFADVGGNLSGQFIGLAEGSLVTRLDGQDLYISYLAGDGNDVALFTAIPEPPVLGLGWILAVGLLFRRGHRNRSAGDLERGRSSLPNAR